MFAQIHLWETGILLIGIALVIIAVYTAKVMKGVAKTVIDIDSIIVENRETIKNILSDVNTITTSMTEIVDDIEDTVKTVKGSISDVGKTVSSTKNYLLRPALKSLNIMKIILSLVKIRSKKESKK